MGEMSGSDEIAYLNRANDNLATRLEKAERERDTAQAACAALTQHVILGCQSCDCGPTCNLVQKRCEACEEGYTEYRIIPNPGQAILDRLAAAEKARDAFAAEADKLAGLVEHRNAGLVAENAKLREVVERLVTATEILLDEQEDSPTYARRREWKLAVDEARAAAEAAKGVPR